MTVADVRDEINWNYTKIMILGIYAPNDNKVMFFKRLLEKLIELSYENWCLREIRMEWCARKKESLKGIKSIQGKL